MILKKISLNNIRSYGSQEITFNNRSVLLSGDIGSGKTSILLAIEFALFGLQPGQRGSSLLRNGEDSGGVSMEFEVEGKKVFIERTLKRGKTVSQDYAAITIDDVKEEIAVTELKSRVLDLLNYPKEFSKKQNLLYKFTVYTPQEEMKQIILQDAKTRVNTLRHIFGIDKYKKVIENTSILISKVKDEKKIKEGMTLTLDQDKLNIASKEEDLRSKDQNLSVIEGDVIIKNDEKRKAQEDLMEVSKQREEKLKLQQEIEKTKIMLSTKNSSLLENNKFMEQIKIQMHELQSISFDESRIQKLDQEVELIKSRKK